MTDETYSPPKVWTWDQESGGRFANINRPISGQKLVYLYLQIFHRFLDPKSILLGVNTFHLSLSLSIFFKPDHLHDDTDKVNQ